MYWVLAWVLCAACIAQGELIGLPGGGWAWPASAAIVVALVIASQGRVIRLKTTGGVVASMLGGCLLATWCLPAGLAAVLATAGCGVALGQLRRGWQLRIGTGLFLGGGALAATYILVLARHHWLAQYHEIPWLCWPLAQITKLLVSNTAVVGNQIAICQRDFTYRFTPTVELLGLFEAVLLVVNWAIIRPAGNTLGLVQCAQVILCLACSILLRYLVLIGWVVGGADASILSNPTVGILLLGVCAVIMALANPNAGAPSQAETPAFSGPESMRKTWLPISIATGVVGIVLILCACVGCDPGVKKAGRILIDEGHSRWERTDTPVDRHTFGQYTTYNYTAMLKVLREHYSVDVTSSELTDEVLSRYDIVFIKTPTQAFTEAETRGLGAYVSRGGGLLVVGDHTNVFGTSDYLNRISGQFGIAFKYDATYDLAAGGLSLYTPTAYLRHPAINALPPFLFATSCSIEGDALSTPVQIGDGLKTLPVDYSQPSFFAEEGRYRIAPFGAFRQSVARTYGRGRVIAFSDSTVWSTFFMYIPGKPELLLGFMEWLNRRASWVGYELTVGFTGVLLLALSLALVWRFRGGGHVGGVLTAVLTLGASAGVEVHDRWVAHCYPLPPSVGGNHTIAFVQEGCSFFVPIDRLIENVIPSYLTFYDWTIRVDATPVIVPTVEAAIARRPDAIVFVRPSGAVRPSAFAALSEYLQGGGSALVLAEDDSHDWAQIGALAGLEPQGRGDPSMRPGPAGKEYCLSNGLSMDISACGREWDSLRHGIRGGAPLIEGTDGIGVMAIGATTGGGRVVVTTGGKLFSDTIMGNTNATATDAQKELYDIEFNVVLELMNERQR